MNKPKNSVIKCPKCNNMNKFKILSTGQYEQTIIDGIPITTYIKEQYTITYCANCNIQINKKEMPQIIKENYNKKFRNPKIRKQIIIQTKENFKRMEEEHKFLQNSNIIQKYKEKGNNLFNLKIPLLIKLNKGEMITSLSIDISTTEDCGKCEAKKRGLDKIKEIVELIGKDKVTIGNPKITKFK